MFTSVEILIMKLLVSDVGVWVSLVRKSDTVVSDLEAITEVLGLLDMCEKVPFNTGVLILALNNPVVAGAHLDAVLKD
ncbi:hypothetical protein FKM82_014497 [Ascaphus truei]